MTVKRKRVITVETWQRTVIRQKGLRPSPKFWCGFCAGEVEMLAPEQAADIFDINLRRIYQAVENGTLHFTNTGDRILICRNSLGTHKKR